MTNIMEKQVEESEKLLIPRGWTVPSLGIRDVSSLYMVVVAPKNGTEG